MEPGATRWLQRWGMGSVELQAVLPVPPMVSCFSICRFREGFVSCWFWDPVGDFWGALIFLCQCSYLPLVYRDVSNLPSCPLLFSTELLCTACPAYLRLFPKPFWVLFLWGHFYHKSQASVDTLLVSQDLPSDLSNHYDSFNSLFTFTSYSIMITWFSAG
jgi:hypothetical protein